jgi:phosphoribosylformylglycinamidine synthase
MASEAFGEESEAKRPTVQVGDPFAEKILLEACLEAMRSDAVVAIQDMGAAGLTSSSLEMAGRGGLGIRLDLDRVPLREPGLSAYEIMLSESQERMVVVARRGREEELRRVFEKWELEVVPIGELTDDGVAELRFAGRTVARIPIEPLTAGAPVYRRPAEVPPDLAQRQADPDVPPPGDAGAALERLLSTVELGDKSWIWRQYDHTVRGNTVIGPGGDAALLRVKGTPRGLGLVCDVNPVYCWLDPRTGGAQAVAEAARNLACVGAVPAGLTDCLNFGSPENPSIAWQFRECVRGMAEASRALGVPVVSGNVSFYNETEGRAIHPTPAVAMVGVVDGIDAHPVSWFRAAGDRILLLGRDRREFGGSAYLRLLHGVEQGRPPAVDLDAEARLGRLLCAGARAGWLRTAHDLSEGGLAVALAEATFPLGLGARVSIGGDSVALFSETQARAVIAVDRRDVERALAEAETMGVPAIEIGEVAGEELEIRTEGEALRRDVRDLKAVWQAALPRALDM